MEAFRGNKTTNTKHETDIEKTIQGLRTKPSLDIKREDLSNLIHYIRSTHLINKKSIQEIARHH